MDSSFREQESDTHTQEAPRSFLASLRNLVSQLMSLVSFIELTEEEKEDAGIYLDRPKGE
jgi:hypothetical protein